MYQDGGPVRLGKARIVGPVPEFHERNEYKYVKLVKVKKSKQVSKQLLQNEALEKAMFQQTNNSYYTNGVLTQRVNHFN